MRPYPSGMKVKPPWRLEMDYEERMAEEAISDSLVNNEGRYPRIAVELGESMKKKIRNFSGGPSHWLSWVTARVPTLIRDLLSSSIWTPCRSCRVVVLWPWQW